MKKLWIDVETTGLDPVTNGVRQISGHIEIDGEIVESFDYKLSPFAEDLVDAKALEVSGVTKEELLQFDPPTVVYADFVKKLNRYIDKYDKTDKMFFMAYNARFDFQFMIEWFKKCGDNYFLSYVWFPAMDIAVLAGDFLEGERHKMRDFKLGTVAEYLGAVIDPSRLHDSMYDIELTQFIYNKIKLPAKFGGSYE